MIAQESLKIFYDFYYRKNNLKMFITELNHRHHCGFLIYE